MTRRFIEPNTKVRSRDGDARGEATGSTHRCRLEGCNGLRVTVQWENGRTTFPCYKGMTVRKDGEWEIL
jgi:hypothetical protein